jgi:hypothetical protein
MTVLQIAKKGSLEGLVALALPRVNTVLDETRNHVVRNINGPTPQRSSELRLPNRSSPRLPRTCGQQTASAPPTLCSRLLSLNFLVPR